MKQVLVSDGNIEVGDVPAPTPDPDEVLVAVEHSAISAGTETSVVEQSSMSIFREVLTDPEKFKRGIELLKEQGFWQAKEAVDRRRDSTPQPLGYSLAGRVVEVGEDIDDLAVGDRVACAGAQHAHHAEHVTVPRNLVTEIPQGIPSKMASSVAIGAIALQGVRRADPDIGETFVVLGLGLVGQLTAQILQANGCQVIGTDLREPRVELAEQLGVDVGLHPDREDDIEAVERLTNGHGADGVIITASSPSDEIVSTAFNMCRRKGRVVLVGDVGLDLDRSDLYRKELDFRMSTSYGAGRYDERFEEKGLDYPIGYVRWTEQRNMEAYLDLVAAEEVSVEPLISATHPIDDAPAAYASFDEGGERPLLVVLSYDGELAEERRIWLGPRTAARTTDTVDFALSGAGSFAKSTHLPNLQDNSHATLRAVVSGTGNNARSTAETFGAGYATTDYDEVLADGDVDAVLVTTRHHLHAEMTLDALEAGKHVLVEKPLALTRDELGRIEAFYEEAGDDAPLLLTGFNRRFSPYAQRITELVTDRSNPMVLNYRMNAGHIPSDHWTQTEEGGGRNLGEACHIYDLFTAFTDAHVSDVSTQSMAPTTDYYNRNDNFNTSMSFEDGSTATLTYTAAGPTEYPKELLELYVDGVVIEMRDYTELNLTGIDADGLSTRSQEKGHEQELTAFVDAIRSGGEWPIPLWQQVQATEIALDVESQLTGGR